MKINFDEYELTALRDLIADRKSEVIGNYGGAISDGNELGQRIALIALAELDGLYLKVQVARHHTHFKKKYSKGKIAAYRAYKKVIGCDLKEAREAIDTMALEYGW